MATFSEVSVVYVDNLVNALKQSAYFAKFIDAFWDLPVVHKKAFLEYILTKVSKKRWVEAFKDDTRWLEIVRGLLVEFSGREAAIEPCKKDLIKLIDGYRSSSNYSEAVKIGKTSFMDDLEAI